jgi:hypothetical protein
MIPHDEYRVGLRTQYSRSYSTKSSKNGPSVERENISERRISSCIYKEDLVLLPMVEPSDQNRTYTERRPAISPTSRAIVTAGFINIDQTIGTQFGQEVEM